MITLPGGYRIELHFTARAPDEPGVVAAIALGDRWGHRYSPPERNGGVAKESVWSEVRRSPPDGRPAPDSTEPRPARPDGAPWRAGQLAVDAEPEEEPELLFAVEAAEEPEEPDEEEEEDVEEVEEVDEADDEPTELLELERLSVR
ncbi:hypothetical protein EDD39_0618 [Kitasatospora cineracea]|uniref:Uncharacterized protein n=1 Tax=Kitasatospora cineracea TaxID=88074 RepID=A0A8G1UEI2_9ACTN|nr:hypothetical protein EDD39_0618 [Kitasatospora cineracea]